jgi:PAS domain S-box-containing protein
MELAEPMAEHSGLMPQPEDDASPDLDWKMVAESIPHSAWIASPDGRTRYANRQSRDYTGASGSDTGDHGWAEHVHPDDLRLALRAWEETVDSGGPYACECRIRRADGAFRWHLVRALPVRGESGRVTQWIGTATDVDDHKRSAAKLQESADRLAEAQRLAHIGSWSIDARTGRRAWSDEHYRLLGYEPQAFEPDIERFFDRLHPDDAARMKAVVLAEVHRSEPWENEFRVVLPGGAVRWLAARTEPVLDRSGDVVGVHGTAQDVTERKQADEQLRMQAHLLDAVGEAVVATDLDGTVIYWGPGAEKLYGWRAEDAKGRSIIEVIPAVRTPQDPAAVGVLGSLAPGDGSTAVLELGRRNGSTFVAEITETPVRDDAGRLEAIIGISSDVSRREESLTELTLAHRTSAEALTLLATLQDEAPVGFGFVDRSFCFVRLNQELAAIIGAPLEDLVGRPVAEVRPELWGRLERIYRHVLDSGEAVRNERMAAVSTGDGVRECLASYYPVRVGEDIIGIGVVVLDVTDRARADGFRSAVMSQVADGVYTQDRDGRLMYMNSAASKMLGWTEKELRGKRMHEAVHFQSADGSPVDAAECALLTKASRGRLERSVGEAFTRKDGSVFPVAYSAAPLHAGPMVVGVAVVFRDVSEPGSSPNVIRVLIADSDRATSRSFQALLDRHEGIEVVSVATTSAAAVEDAARLSPHVLLVNFDLPDLDGLATAAIVEARSPSTNVILMTDMYDDRIALASIDAGCAGVLDKSRAWVELVSAVRAAHHGERIISQAELQRVLSQARGREHRGQAAQLTDREEEVLACIREGLPNSAVADRLGVTPNTVRNHVQRILYKLNVHSKLEAVVLTSREGVHGGRQ